MFIDPEGQRFCWNNTAMIYFFYILLLCNNTIFGIRGCMRGGANVLFQQKG